MKDLPITMMPEGWMEKTGGYAKDMTLRDYFAAKAMQAMISSSHCTNTFSATQKAQVAYTIADEMLKVGQ